MTDEVQVFSKDELNSFADELFNLDELLRRAEAHEMPTEQLALDVQPGVQKDDAAHASMMRALEVSQAHKRGRGQRGGTAFHNTLREEMHKAFVVLGGWKFLVACVASKDDVLRNWALGMFTKAAGNAGVLASFKGGSDGAMALEGDKEFNRFVMALLPDQESAQELTNRVARVMADDE